MLKTTCPLTIGENHMERQPLDGSLLACCAYQGDIHDYVGSQVTPHWHRELEVLVVDSGALLVCAAQSQLSLRPGQGCFINANKLHSITCATLQPCRYRSVVFAPSVISGAAGSVYDVKYVRPFVEQGPPVLALEQEGRWFQDFSNAFRQAFQACAGEEVGYEFAVRAALSQLFLMLMQCGGQTAPSRPATLREERLKQMIEWFDANYSSPFSVQALADSVHLSPRECQRIFQRLLNTSPKAYLLTRRIAAATELLAGQDLPVIEVAARCGFTNHSYFSRQFCAVTGHTPREYRLLARAR